MDFLFHGLKEQDKETLLSKIKIVKKSFLRNEVIFHEGSTCNSIAYIEAGSVTAKRIYADGHETIIRVLEAKDTFGEALVFSSDNLYKASFYSNTHSVIKLISYADLLTLINASPIISLNMLNKISDNLIVLNNKIKILSKKTVKSKICEYLYLEYTKHNAKTFTVNLNKTEIANLLNIERPTFSKELSGLITDGVIANSGYSYTIINYKRFEEYL